MLFEKLVEQHRVHRFVANRVNLPGGIENYQVRIHLFYLLSYQAELRDALGVKLVLVAEGHRFERENRFARLVHRLDRFLEPGRGWCRAKLAAAIYDNG